MTDSLGDVLCFLQNPDRLFSFFGCFGDVVRVKVMFRKQDTALIQFVDDFHVREKWGSSCQLVCEISIE